MFIKTPVRIVAKKLKVTTQTVYGWKLGRYSPSVSRLRDLAKIEGKTVDKLLKLR